VITAAGNEGPDLDTVGYPAGFPEMVAVGSIDRRKKLSRFSSRGRQVDVVAPGDEITSCYPPRSYATLSGTSMATPFISGVVALALAKHRKIGGKTPLRTQQDLIEHLCRTSADAGLAGFDPLYGCGIVNPAKLIQGVKS
jgi:subtilisin